MARRAGGQQALNLRENRAFVDAVTAAQWSIYHEWMLETDRDERERLHAEGKALERVTRAIEQASAQAPPIREVV